jgi:hypothetical protein
VVPDRISVEDIMPQAIDLKAKGLYTHPNPLTVPQGGLLVADNTVIDREDTNEAARGFKLYGAALTISGSQKPNKMFNYQDRLLLQYHNKLAYDSDNAGTWTNLSGTFVAPTGAQYIRAMEANKNLYLTTSTGIRKLDAYNGTPTDAGIPKAIDIEGATTGGSGFLSNNQQVAYRVLWGITDANGNKIVGAPSQRDIVNNATGGTRDINVTFTVPAGITTSHFYQVFRSGESGGVAVEPSDELQLVVEKNPSSGEVSAKSVTYLDQTPDNLRGAALYSNPNQEGINQSNNQPPLAKDIAFFKDSAFYLNTVSKHRMYITLIAIGGSVGLANDDTITIAGVTYTGKASEDVGSDEFLVYAGGTASQNIDTTAKSLIKVINQSTSTTDVYAYYLTGYNDLPGQILIEERSLGGSIFYAISDAGAAFSPTIPASGTSYASTNESLPNRVFISKTNEPEAVPILNFLDVGSARQPIRRGIALRDSLFILKDDGIFRITGETFADFRVSLFDSTTKIMADETAVAFNNQVFCLSDQGVVAISEAGVAIMSRQIENTLIKLMTSQYTNFASTAWAFAYESERKYGLGIITETDDTYTTQIFVYNVITSSWTRWPRPFSCGVVSDRDGKLYCGSADSDIKYVREERKLYDVTDYADRELDLVILSSDSSAKTIEIADTTGLVAGWTVAQFNGTIPVRESVIVSVDDSTHVTVDSAENWSIGVAKGYEPIQYTLTWAPIHGGNPALIKQFQDHVIIFKGAQFDSFTFKYTSDFSVTEEEVDLVPIGIPYGLFTWPGPTTAVLPWGGNNPGLQPIRTYVPKEKAMAHWLNITASLKQALKQFSIVGMSLFTHDMSSRMK